MIVGRIDIIKEEGGILYLIHAKETEKQRRSGRKSSP